MNMNHEHEHEHEHRMQDTISGEITGTVTEEISAETAVTVTNKYGSCSAVLQIKVSEGAFASGQV